MSTRTVLKYAKSRLSVAACLLAASGAPAFAGASFFDGTFNPSDWTVTANPLAAAGSYNVTQQSVGGAPGDFQQVQINSTNGLTDLYLYSSFTYNPAAQGAISTLGMSFSVITENGGPLQYDALFLQQGGTVYRMAAASQIYSTWTNFPENNTVASDWADGSGSHPDFSSSGGLMNFGYIAANSQSYSTAGIDNFAVTIDSSNPVPEPSSLFLLAGAVVLGWRARKFQGFKRLRAV